MERIIKILGFSLTLTGVLTLGIIYFPIISQYVFIPPLKQEFSANDYYLTIPKIHAQAPVIADVNPWSQTDYESALKRGIAEAQGFAKPGQKGTVFLFAHSSSTNPWEMTRTNTAFLRLGELDLNDRIFIVKDGKQYQYKVVDKREVWPQDISNLKSGSDLILQTCTPIGTSLKRLLIFASKS